MINEFFEKGYNDYPLHDNYPTRDKHSAEEELQYLRGWRSKASSSMFADQVEFEPNGRNQCILY